MSELKYRSEIDGLRALAVMSVLAYHAEFGFFPFAEGGFLGVDIFFVISGYLITRIILSEFTSSKSFSFKKFYIRRVRRIAPMLIVVCAVSWILGWVYLQPTAFKEFSSSMLSALFSVSNIYFYSNQSAYGAVEALQLPLLHTWSLSVEEQFYLFFPLLIVLFLGRSQRWFWAGLAVIFWGSLFWCVSSIQLNPEMIFFLPFTRFWEMMVGSFLAGFEVFSGGKSTLLKPRPVASVASVSILLLCIVTFNSETVHPGLATLIPVGATAVWIATTDSHGAVGRLFGSRPMVYIGLISYSAYLWHYPLFAFLRAGGEPRDVTKFLIIAGTFVLSLLTYRFIERPFRNSSSVSTKRVLGFVCSSVFILSALVFVTVSKEGFPNRVRSVEGFELFVEDNQLLRDKSWSLVARRDAEGGTFREVDTRVLIVGNSHGKDLFNALTLANPNLKEFDFLYYQTNFGPSAKHFQIEYFGEQGKESVAKATEFFNSEMYSSASVITVSTRFAREESRVVQWTTGLQLLVRRALEDGKKVVVFGNTPAFDQAPDGRLLADFLFAEVRQKSPPALDRFDEEGPRLLFELRKDEVIEAVNEQVRSITEESGAVYVDKEPFICDLDNETCTLSTVNRQKVLYDAAHWTLEGAEMIGGRMLAGGVYETLKK